MTPKSWKNGVCAQSIWKNVSVTEEGQNKVGDQFLRAISSHVFVSLLFITRFLILLPILRNEAFPDIMASTRVKLLPIFQALNLSHAAGRTLGWAFSLPGYHKTLEDFLSDLCVSKICRLGILSPLSKRGGQASIPREHLDLSVTLVLTGDSRSHQATTPERTL